MACEDQRDGVAVDAGKDVSAVFGVWEASDGGAIAISG